MTETLIVIFIVIWMAQIILGYRQIHLFNQFYAELAKKSAFIGVGKSSGRFKPKVLMIIGLNAEHKIEHTLLMDGLTVFSRPKSIPELFNLYWKDIQPELIFPNQKRHQEALISALKEI